VAAVDAAMGMPGDNPLSPAAAFSHDAFDPRAQKVLDKAMKAVRAMSTAARKELTTALKVERPEQMAQAVVQFIRRYQTQLADLLGRTNLAALLEGAKEVASKMPPAPIPGVGGPIPPSLGPDAAVGLLAKLEAMPEQERNLTIYNLPADQQEYIRGALAGGGLRPPLLPFTPERGGEGDVHFPIIEEAVKNLSERNVLTRPEYDRMDAAARAKAFTVANAEATETLAKIRDALAENVAEGADYEAFREKVLSDVEPNTFLSEGHMENVWRTNVQTGFSDGQMVVLNHPFIRDGFPYATYNSIHDDRRRPEHGEMEKLGIQGTNVYRIDDPVFQLFRPPWGYNERCNWSPMTVLHAAERGIAEAKQWLASGIEPSPPAFVRMPDFRPPPGFDRSLAPLSIRLSLQPMDLDAEFGLDAQGLWHGPKPPGPDWVPAQPGPRGGKVWARRQGAAPYEKRPTLPPKAERPQIDEMVGNLHIAIQKGIEDADLAGYADTFMKMSAADIHEVKRQLGLKASGNKLDLAKKVAARAMRESQLRFRKPPGARPVRPTQPDQIDKNADIADRLKQYKSGDEKVKSIAGAGVHQRHVADETLRIQKEIDALYAKRKSLKSMKLGKRDSEALQRLYQAQNDTNKAALVPTGNVRDAIKKMLQAPNPGVVGFTQTALIAKSNIGVQEAKDWLSGMIEGNITQDVYIQGTNANRAFANKRNNSMSINVRLGRQIDTVIHEWGHHLENFLPGADKAVRQFLNHRLKGEKPQKLKTVLPTRSFDDSEHGAKDEFDKAFGDSGWYVGKIYRDGQTELISMGLEKLWQNGPEFAQKDPEYCKFILGILDGSLR
jgi:hypothetical protein